MGVGRGRVGVTCPGAGGVGVGAEGCLVLILAGVTLSPPPVD